MAIRAVILDVSGTLISLATQKVVPGVPEMLERLRAHNLTIFVASNDVSSTTLAGRELGVDDDHLLNLTTVGGRKGTKRYTGAIRARFGIAPNELLYLGDARQDSVEAVNSDVAFFQATWPSSPLLSYGIPVASPSEFADIVEAYFLKQAPWYYRVDDRDSLDRPVIVRALIDIRKAEERGIKNLLKGIDQRGEEDKSRQKLIRHLSRHLLASIYLEGLYLPPVHSGVIWALYPSHGGAQTGVLDEFATMASRLFRDTYQDIILRHTVAEKLAFLRKQKKDAPIDIQLQSICLNAAFRKKIAGKTILLFDDFTTHAHSFETARNFLLNAGADHVISIAVGKFPSLYLARSPKPAVQWDSFTPVTLTKDDFIDKRVNEVYTPAALDVFDGLYPGSGVAADTSTRITTPRATSRTDGENLLATVQQQWGKVKMTCRTKSPKLAALLNDAEPSSLEPGVPPTLIIQVPYDFYLQKLRMPASLEIITWALDVVVGKTLHVRVIKSPSLDF